MLEEQTVRSINDAAPAELDSQAGCTAIYHTCYEMMNQLCAQAVQASLQFCNGAWWVLKDCNLSPELLTCSTGFKSGEFAGHDMRWMFSVSRKSSISTARRHGSLSSLNIKSGPIAPRNK
ncbi:hypothetical protein TNCV_2637581 [Trichonephila clavipes]|nr:hypothetical protein TNCV_2637581 [Trichonephila clavipes]